MSQLRVRPTVLLPLHDHRAFLDHYFNQGGVGGVFVPGYVRLPDAEEVDLEIVFANDQITVHSRGVIRWRRGGDDPSLPAGIGVEFLESERGTRDLLLDLAEGKQITLHRRASRRYPVMLDIEYGAGSVFLADVTDDLSENGASIVTDHDMEIGEIIELRLKVPGDFGTIALKGEVRWRRTRGRKALGVRFIFDDPESEEQIRSLIDHVKEHQAAEFGAADD